MPKFTDKKGRVWEVEITVGDLDALVKDAGFDLSPAFAGKADLIDAIYGDQMRLFKGLWVLCETQAKAAGVSPEDFGRSIGGPQLCAGGDAVLEAVADFRHRPAVAAEVKAHLPTALAKIERRLTEAYLAQMTSTSGESAGNSPAPPASTPVP